MRTLIAVLVLLMVSVSAPLSRAQDEDENTSNVSFFFVACSDSVIINLSGTMEAGFDVFYQVFSGPAGTGSPLSSLRRVAVDGAYAFSEQLAYNEGAMLAAGSVASARISIARETDPANTLFSDTVDDLQDGCSNPQNPLAESFESDDPAGLQAGGDGAPAGSILSPFGGVLNPDVTPDTEPVVVLGARQPPPDPRRTANPGLIFAECDRFRSTANPGLLYDSDNIIVFWSWFAKTPELVQEHVANANYSVKLNTAPFLVVNQSEITERNGIFWVFFTANVRQLRPGHYEVEYKLDWDAPISDGFDEFGPGTATPRILSLCNFDVRPNPQGDPVAHNPIYRPTEGPVHALQLSP